MGEREQIVESWRKHEGLASIDALESALRHQDYIASRDLTTSLYLALTLERPLFLEGETGVGKTEVAKVLASLLGTELIRLQCYEGLDVQQAVYEWNYTRQMMSIRMSEGRGEEIEDADIFGKKFLLKRPLMQALEYSGNCPAVLLIDEIDRSDDEFEALLLEILSEFQITIPELGTVRANDPPIVILTSNRTREIHDALKRRCVYCWIEFPSFEKELEIVLVKVPDAPVELARQVTAYVQEIREQDLYKTPGVAETLDWLKALVILDQKALEIHVVEETLGVILKYQDDIQKMKGDAAISVLERVRAKQ